MAVTIHRGISKEKIFAAAEELTAAGSPATLAAVRAKIGGGSYTTISEALKEWRAGQEAPATMQEPAPAALHEQLAGVVASAWATAVELANERLAGERAALATARADLEQSRTEAIALADQVNTELEQAQATIAERDAAAAAAALEITRKADEALQLTRDLAAANESAHTAQAALVEAHGRIDQLSALLEREQAARVKSVERAAQAEQASAVCAARLTDAEARAAKFEREFDDAKKEAAAASSAAKKSGEEAAELRGRMAQASAPKAAKPQPPGKRS